MSHLESLATTRTEYQGNSSDLVGENPFEQFSRWYEEVAEHVHEPNAMVVSTVDEDGPDSRIVLLKEFSPEGFVFFTNYDSTKGRQIAENPHVALVFPWHAAHRQVRVRGVAERVPAQQSDAYFAVRPRGSQIGAIASRQSQPVGSREELDEAYARAEAAAGDPVVRPDNWGGYVVRAHTLEFWHGSESRMHDRFQVKASQVSRLDDAAAWTVQRLFP
ncbi:pyridoxamine 5'-phosphate oxidase [Brevibacterium sp. UMB1308A]|uniref:pyridoxamine 5'-phosphate oxidase n=1 Tax=Brevibacterium sp. UMB1308A TaxID=3050608 RepID=UPI00254E38BF|nr:pyridoxamine 5'-phosphate oxidase [Brevibacterium sp. UMB1308A]MDK8346135.1 pyridoxamine 5'-phosphate oxidase [Brevibacterium sp. UMB1308B]MDK8712431.1 pyridoxamine 5'-phosphate oxidase [Brevibacterium sp. UMB1308A]